MSLISKRDKITIRQSLRQSIDKNGLLSSILDFFWSISLLAPNINVQAPPMQFVCDILQSLEHLN